MSIALSILPVLLTILTGYLIAALGAVPRDKWDSINTLIFRILIPAIIINSIARSDLSGLNSGPWIMALLATLAIVATTALTLRRLFDRSALPNPQFTTLFQTTTRWNVFVALAAAEQFIGAQGLALLALAMAILIPIINVTNIVVLVAFGSARTSFVSMCRSILQNPLVIGCMIGLAINLSGIDLPEPVLTTLALVGRAALGMGLLAVGAGIVLGRLLATSWKVWLGVVLRLGLCPLVFLGLACALDLNLTEALTGALAFSVPAASNGYVIAQRMGGDADLYADILTWQTILSLAILPLIAIAVHQIF